jgi:hypothetical protein
VARAVRQLRYPTSILSYIHSTHHSVRLSIQARDNFMSKRNCLTDLTEIVTSSLSFQSKGCERGLHL